jgi:DNA-binding GntR family transcriptional regulator
MMFQRGKAVQKKFPQIWEDIADELKQAIIQGKLKGGERLKIADLSQQYGVSNTPIREAFHYLANLGFVENIPRRMVVVKEVTLKEVEDFYSIQAALEGLAAGLTTRRLDHGGREKFESIFLVLQKSARNKDIESYSQADTEWHAALIDNCDNERLKQLARNSRDHIERFRFIMLRQPGRIEESFKEHRKVMESMRAGDAEAVENCMRTHVRISAELLKKIVSRGDSPAPQSGSPLEANGKK